MNRIDEAMNCYGLAIKHNPTYSGAYNKKGICLKDLNRLDEALAPFDMVIKLNPAHSNAHYNKGLCLEELNRPVSCKTLARNFIIRNCQRSYSSI